MPSSSTTRKRSARLGIVVTAVVAALVAGSITAQSRPASAAVGDVVVPPGELAVTFVARTCDDYTDIMANRARNNIQESLRDLGSDSVYQAGAPISPDLETPNNPDCVPLPGWDFQIGTAIQGKTEADGWLSTLSGSPFPDEIRTAAGPIPELDAQGVDTGRTIEGATTVTLSSGAAAWVRQGRQLWVQGGTQANPLPPSGAYGFGALRCSVDNLNGDNVEFVSFPTLAGSAARHVFCYYYAVSPPPEAGTITVVKELAGVSGEGAEQFDFEGNISYDRPSETEPGRFSLSPTVESSASMTFVRGAVEAGGDPWTFRELPRSGWLTSGTPTCTTAPGIDSPWSYSPDTGFAVSLLPGDDVTCTIVNTKAVTASLQKQTIGGVGTFPFVVETPDSTDQRTITTTEESTPVVVDDTPVGSPGTYRATETLPAPDAFGAWSLESGTCLGNDAAVDTAGDQASLTVAVEADTVVSCMMTNRYTPNGEIVISKTSIGGVAEFHYSITPGDRDSGADDGPGFDAVATTTAEGEAVTAIPRSGSSSATNLALGSTWTIQETVPAPSALGFWRVTSAHCGDAVTVRNPATETITVTIPSNNGVEASPLVECEFVNEFVSTANVQVIKHTTGDETLRPDPAELAWSCGEQAFAGTVLPGQTEFVSAIEEIQGAGSCTVTETDSGAADDVDVTTTATLISQEGAEPVAYTLGEPFDLIPGQTATVTIENALTSVPPPNPTPTPSDPPSEPAPEPPDEGGLATTGGEFNPSGVALFALLVLLGTTLLAFGRSQRRDPREYDGR